MVYEEPKGHKISSRLLLWSTFCFVLKRASLCIGTLYIYFSMWPKQADQTKQHGQNENKPKP